MTTPRHNQFTPKIASRGFTIIELLVVILIISASLATVVPLIGVLTRTSRVEAGINTISAAINAARILSHRKKEPSKALFGDPFPASADYSGTAVIFCPGGDIRFVINYQQAYAGPPATFNATDPNFIENFATKSNGYADIAGVDFAKLPNGSGIVGVRRTGTGPAAVEFLPPPFAVRFNERGQVATDQIIIYYDSNYDLSYNNSGSNVTQTRPLTYNPAKWLPKSNIAGNLATLGPSNTYRLPFEQIETVSAIVLYDENLFRAQGGNWYFEGTPPGFTDAGVKAPTNDPLRPAGYTPGINGIYEWLQVHGRALYFSPYTGLVIPESLQ
jgi:prepilin-type N-terminal cleavage/methylation domain-containing protein